MLTLGAHVAMQEVDFICQMRCWGRLRDFLAVSERSWQIREDPNNHNLQWALGEMTRLMVVVFVLAFFVGKLVFRSSSPKSLEKMS